MRPSDRTLLILLATAAAWACVNSTPTSPSDLLLTTDSSSYTATPIGYSQVTLRIVTQYRNPAAAAIALDRCFPTSPSPIFDVELVTPKSNDGSGYNPAWACVGHDRPIVIGAGETRIDTLVLRGPNAYDPRLARYLGTLEGTFRIGYGGQRSNEFRVKLPPGGIVVGPLTR